MLSDRDYFNRPPSDNFWQRHSAVFLLIVANVVVYLLTMLTGGTTGAYARRPSLLVVGGELLTDSSYAWQIWRLVTYQFLHANFWHLFLNMYGVWLFGGMVERELGKIKTIILYLFSGVLGGIFFILANWNNSTPPCVGASGSLFGLMVAAAIAFQNDLDPDENVRRMDEASQHVKTAMVTYAIRDSEYNGIQIKQGDIIGLHNGQIEFSGSSVRDVVMDMMKSIVTEDDELITVYFGADVSEEDAKSLADEIEAEYDFCDVECHNGGQPLYYYLISVE